ncbi:putative penicillin-binding protein PbpX [Rubripirellula obstinata]|uniref:Putative penicillin-binding protein PbpX n=1 Tax=Rubripirellula obstinata TaxID=406547 RepID=A0A5B1CG82_9BACT|nr:serine hydrolase domain-containing protein [Rubripirellula obstinata]KAA1259192.1 putative penicillin-binding protein PbpX [Rubripirellula obstinata]
MNKISLIGFAFLLMLILMSPLPGQDPLASRLEAQEFSGEAGTKLRNCLDASVRDGSVPGGIVILIHRGETVFRESFGYRDLRNQRRFELTTPFRAASLSKSIISTLVVELASEGILDLEDPIDKALPKTRELRLRGSKPLDRMPTLRECLHHTAGFTADEAKGGRPWLLFRGQGVTLAEAVDAELKLPMARQPGVRFAYSGIGYDIVGRVIEVATGQLLEDVLQNRMCKPLGMTGTTFYADEDSADELASFYWRWRSDGSFRRQLDPRIVPHGQYASVGGGIVTTADDLAKFMLMHRNGGLVDGKTWTEKPYLQQQYFRKRPGAFYGLGFTLGTAEESGVASWILHTGSSGTMFWWDRQTDTIGIIVTQQRYSDGDDIPETEKRIAKDADSWQATLKADYIDPVFGWRPLKKGYKIIP